MNDGVCLVSRSSTVRPGTRFRSTAIVSGVSRRFCGAWESRPGQAVERTLSGEDDAVLNLEQRIVADLSDRMKNDGFRLHSPKDYHLDIRRSYREDGL